MPREDSCTPDDCDTPSEANIDAQKNDPSRNDSDDGLNARFGLTQPPARVQLQ